MSQRYRQILEGLLDVRCEYLPTLMITDEIKVSEEKTDSVSGNLLVLQRV